MGAWVTLKPQFRIKRSITKEILRNHQNVCTSLDPFTVQLISLDMVHYLLVLNLKEDLRRNLKMFLKSSLFPMDKLFYSFRNSHRTVVGARQPFVAAFSLNKFPFSSK
nr:hypothetical protein [Tanacetum cinerariifolium]